MSRSFKVRRIQAAVAVLMIASALVAPHANAATNPRPTKIISLSPSATEILFAIGAGPQVIAVDDNSDFPSNAPMTKLSSYAPNVEAIAAYQPDLVVIQSSATGASNVIASLKKLNINVFVEETPATINDAYKEFVSLGSATGHPSRAKALIASMKSQISEIVAKYRKKTPLRIYHELDNTPYSADSTSFIGQMYADFNVTNIADAASSAAAGGYPQLTSELVVKANPQAIFLDDAIYGESETTLAKRPGWSGISAIKTHHVISLPADIPDRWGPRIVDFYRLVGKAIASIN